MLGQRDAGIWHRSHPLQACGPVIFLDLTRSDHQGIVTSWLRAGSIAAVSLAPPCGTASRAREIKGSGGPGSLRSDQWPDGLPGLNVQQAARVEAANKLYHFTAKVVALCKEANIPWVVENPRNSLFWMTSAWTSVQSSADVTIDLQACAFGGLRPKWTRLVGNMEQLQLLARTCPGCVAHAPWGRKPDGSWATAEEAAYPVGLCTEWAAMLHDVLNSRGVCCVSHSAVNKGVRENANVQARGTPVFPLVDEWKCIVYIVGPSPELSALKRGKRLLEDWSVPDGTMALPAVPRLPRGSQILSRSQKGGRLSPQLSAILNKHPEHEVFRVGIPWTHIEFIREAARKGHPCHKLSSTNPSLQVTLELLGTLAVKMGSPGQRAC